MSIGKIESKMTCWLPMAQAETRRRSRRRRRRNSALGGSGESGSCGGGTASRSGRRFGWSSSEVRTEAPTRFGGYTTLKNAEDPGAHPGLPLKPPAWDESVWESAVGRVRPYQATRQSRGTPGRTTPRSIRAQADGRRAEYQPSVTGALALSRVMRYRIPIRSPEIRLLLSADKLTIMQPKVDNS